MYKFKPMKIRFLILLTFVFMSVTAQEVMTPEQMIELKKISAKGVSKDGQYVIYSTSQYSFATDKSTKKLYKIPINGGTPATIENADEYLNNDKISADGKYLLYDEPVKIDKVFGSDYYTDVPESNVYVYDDLNYRHWDTWEDGRFDHVMIKDLTNPENTPVDVLKGKPYECPTKPFGGPEDYVWNTDGTEVLYVAKKLTGTTYALSTNTDIYAYNIKTGDTRNLTDDNEGYDTHPACSAQGQFAWLQMKRNGYEADKNDIIVLMDGKPVNLTAGWDGTVNGFKWSASGEDIYFTAPVRGTHQLFKLSVPKNARRIKQPVQLTKGQFDITGIIGQSGDKMVVGRMDMNHPTELYVVDLKDGKMRQLTHENDEVYNRMTLGKIEKRMVTTTDGKEMLTWVIFPPNFDPNKKYPTLLYCQGGPQSMVSQFFSYRWNFQQMAAHGYIVVAPNRRGLPGFGVEWNEQISKDYGGQNIKDYLSAIDEVAKEPYVDNERLGCIGASYGGYSVFFLAGNHEGRFKSFIAHDGIFNERSMYGTTEEVFFTDWDLGGPYWDKDNVAAQKAFNEFNPINYVHQWDTPIMIIQGGRDYRVPIGQALEAFQAAKLRGLKSRLLY
ncbi:MAG: S9 family peptidase, partial [Flavobacteriia bacterium]